MWSLHVLPVHVWVLSKYSAFLPQSKNMLGLIGHSKLPVGVIVKVCLSVQFSSATYWQQGHGVPDIMLVDSWDRLQPPMTLNRISSRTVIPNLWATVPWWAAKVLQVGHQIISKIV